MYKNLATATGIGAVIALLAGLVSFAAPAWAVACLAGVLAAIASFLLIARSQGATTEVTSLLTAINRDGDLSRRANGSPLGKLIGALVDSFQALVAKVVSDSHLIVNATEGVGRQAAELAGRSKQQREAAERTAQAIEEMTIAVYEMTENASQTAQIAREAQALSEQGKRVVGEVSNEIEGIARLVENSASVVANLGERSQEISSVVKTIREIAEQTNLLALNAAIEAARAGEQGRGFAVVADEVRKLAERTETATREIGRMIAAIQDETQTAIASISAGTQQARDGAEHARGATDSLDAIESGARGTMEKVGAIAGSIEEQSRRAESINTLVRQILSMADENLDSAEKTRAETAKLAGLATNLSEIDRVFRLGDAGRSAIAIHERMPGIVRDGARALGEALERAIANGKIDEADVFDDNYRPISGTKPQKYHTKFDSLTDELFPAIQEPLLERWPELVYAGAVDRKGYFPTHNRRFSQPLTGNHEHDLAHNRTKRIFDDPVGRRCGAHELDFLVQTYRRDTGEVMHDISAPIHVHGRHWGGLRIGYRA